MRTKHPNQGAGGRQRVSEINDCQKGISRTAETGTASRGKSARQAVFNRADLLGGLQLYRTLAETMRRGRDFDPTLGSYERRVISKGSAPRPWGGALTGGMTLV